MKRFKYIFKNYDVFIDPISLDIVDNLNSIIVYNNGPKSTGVVINTGYSESPIILTGQQFVINGNELELFYNNELKIIPYFGLPTITIIYKTFYE